MFDHDKAIEAAWKKAGRIKKEMERKRKKRKRFFAVTSIIVVCVLGLISWKSTNRLKPDINKDNKPDDECSQEFGSAEIGMSDNPSLLQEELRICEVYQFMLFEGTVYIASTEDIDRIGAAIGTARVRNEEKESITTLFKDVVVYEFEGIEPTIAVIAYYPEEQEYYVYYNSTFGCFVKMTDGKG